MPDPIGRKSFTRSSGKDRSGTRPQHDLQQRILGVVVFLAINLPAMWGIAWFMETAVLPPNLVAYSQTIVAVLYLGTFFFMILGYIRKLQRFIDPDEEESEESDETEEKRKEKAIEQAHVSTLFLAAAHLGITCALFMVISIVIRGLTALMAPG